MRDSGGLIEGRPLTTSRRGGDIAFAAISLLAVAVRARALAHSGAPPGFDGGDWLALGRGLIDGSVRPSGVTAAPVVPLLTFASVSIVGSRAFVVLGSVLSVAPATGVYLLLRLLVPTRSAVAFSAFLVGAAAVGEAASWGGYPQLLGLALVPPVLLLVDRGLEKSGWTRGLMAGAGLLAVALVSDFVFAFAVAATALLVTIRLLRGRGLFLSTIGIGAPLALALPLYARILATRVAAVTQPARLLGETSPGLYQRVTALWYDAQPIWWLLVLAAEAALLVRARRGASEAHWRLASAMVVPATVFVAVFREPRLAYFVPSAVVVAAALWSNALETERWAPYFLGVLAACLVVQSISVPSTAKRQAARYEALTPGLVRGIVWLREQTPRDALVVVTPYREAPPVGWWVEGLARRRTLSASSPEWVYFDSERKTAAQAGRILSAGVPTPATLAIARRFRADFVFIDKRWPDYVPGRVTSLEDEIPGVVVFENASVVILRTRAPR